MTVSDYSKEPGHWQRVSQDMRETVMAMWNAGKTAGEIAKVIGRTRNSVFGIVTRWPGEKRRCENMARFSHVRKQRLTPGPVARDRVEPSLPKITPAVEPDKPQRPPKIKAISGLPVPSQIVIPSDPRDILNVTGCRWPVTADPAAVGGYLFCNAHRDDLKSYCPEHERKKVKAK